MRLAIFLYGVISYVLFLAVFLYAIGFVGGFGVPKGIDDGVVGDTTTALLFNVALLSVFAIQHSVMARPGFKAKWTKVIGVAAERTTYVMITNVLFIVLYWQWQPLPEVVWSVEGTLATALWVLFGAGWVIALLSTFIIDHFDLFGLRQVTAHLQGKEYVPTPYVERFFYRHVRHPLMLGFIIAFWATPTMTQGHLLFAIMTTAYMLVAIHIEERDLVAAHGDDYRSYQSRVSMILPLPKGKRS